MKEINAERVEKQKAFETLGKAKGEVAILKETNEDLLLKIEVLER
jgi:hypothetical protein